jgi:hypothetical protein
MAAVECEHGRGCHDGAIPSQASAPTGSRAWLLIEHPGPWPEQELDTALPEPLRTVADGAAALKIRVQMIRRPDRRRLSRRTAELPETMAGATAPVPGAPADAGERSVFAGWAAGSSPWLRRGAAREAGQLDGAALAALAQGREPAFGTPMTEPLFLVCAHGRRDACCARFGAPLARSLARQDGPNVWETTHVGGHKYAANLVILPHGLYYGPVDEKIADAAIDAYQRGEVTLDRYRGRAGQDQAVQEAEHAALMRTGARLPLSRLP